MAKYKFDDIAFNSTAKKKPVEEDRHTYLGLEHLDGGKLHVSRFGTEVAPIGAKLLMKKGDVLFGKRRAYQKKVAIAPFDGIFSAHGMVLRPKEDVINKDFFPFFISSDYFLDAAIRISTGSLSPTINWKALKELEFNLPDLKEQERLAKILWAAEDSIISCKKALLALNKYLLAFEDDAFCLHLDDDSNVPGRELRCIADLAYIDPAVPKELLELSSFIAMKDLSEDGKIISHELRNTKEVKKGYTYFAAGDVLMAKITPCMENGKGAFVENLPIPQCFGSTEFFVLRPKKTQYASYIYSLIMAKKFRMLAEGWMQGSAGQRRVSKDIFTLRKIWVPSNDEQINFIGSEFKRIKLFRDILLKSIGASHVLSKKLAKEFFL